MLSIDTAEVIRNREGDATVMLKRLADGKLALAAFNRNPKQETTVKVAWSEIGLKKPPAHVLDAWRHRRVEAAADHIAVRLSPDGVGLFVLSPRDGEPARQP